MKKKSTEPPATPADAAQPAPGQGGEAEPIGDAVLRDIARKAAEGNIKYQELYLKYIDLIRAMPAGDEVIYEATFVDDKDQEA